MNNIGIQALLSLESTHLMLTHLELMEMIGFVRALGNSYRLAASGPGSSVIYGRFTLDFFRTIVARVVR
ncbi:hypothetical protein [Bradyrhizobium amphicarpaeae]|uniref:Uncharacterized protein n=1 Tax=Bradyrhizobium amphicarpaeae TaxID=1404768 RepID=A0A2U8PS37_9BRAD|nr:hypothetical protein [Bradyrhizobium amphicarpaeae]AWM00599.1 hypothetical protein CIT40_11535 [Bradyrhizobium amphicarpaeae]